MKRERVLTVSEVQTFDTCPRMWELRYHKGLQQASSSALRIGTAVHQWFARRLSGEAEVPLIQTVTEEEDEKQAEDLELALEEWKRRYSPPPWTKVLKVEEAMTLDLGWLKIQGKPDAVVEWQGRIWHVQHKTVGGSVPLVAYVQGIQNSLHEGLYCRMLESLGRVGGTMLNVVRKLSRKTLEREPGTALHLEFIPITDEMRDGVMEDLSIRARRISDQEEILLENPKARVYRNRTACHGKYGNSRCAYYGVCWEGEEESTLIKEDPLERYKEEGNA